MTRNVMSTVESHLNKSFAGQVILWLSEHIQEPHFITSLTLWTVKTAARLLEPLLLFCATYLMISEGIPSLSVPHIHAFSLSVLIGAPDVILPGGFVTTWQKMANKQYGSAIILFLLLTLLAALTGIANATIFGVVHMDEAGINQLLFYRAMLGLAYSTTIIITLLADKQRQEETVSLPTMNVRLDQVAEQQRILVERTERTMNELAEHVRLLGTSVTEHIQFVAKEISSVKYTVNEQTERTVTELTERANQQLGLMADQFSSIADSITDQRANERHDQIIIDLDPVISTLAQHTEVLAFLPDIVSRMQTIEQLTQLHMSMRQKQIQTLPRPVEHLVTSEQTEPEQHMVPAQPVSNSQQTHQMTMNNGVSETPGEPNTKTNTFDKGAFVRQCLSETPTIRNSEIQRKASAINQVISAGYISDIRKAFFFETTSRPNGRR